MQIETPDRISDPEASHYFDSGAREKLVSNVIRNCPLCVMKNCPHHLVYDLG